MMENREYFRPSFSERNFQPSFSHLIFFRAQTERWVLSQDIQLAIPPTLDNDNYSFGVGLVLVDKRFCSA